jgi:hypothetical protein
MNMFRPWPALLCPSSVDELRKYLSMKTRSDELSDSCGGLRYQLYGFLHQVLTNRLYINESAFLLVFA